MYFFQRHEYKLKGFFMNLLMKKNFYMNKFDELKIEH